MEREREGERKKETIKIIENKTGVATSFRPRTC